MIKTKIYFLFMFLILFSELKPQEKSQNELEEINIIISNDVLGNVNRSDARAAMELVLKEIVGELSLEERPIIPEIVNKMDEIKKRIMQGRADAIALFSLDYLNYKSELPIKPLFLVQKNKALGVQYILLTHKQSNINSLSDLKSKKILVLANREEEIVEKWLYVEMSKAQIKNPFEIINSFTKIPKPSKRVFPVFFGKVDCCILTKAQFNSMCELNPQLRNELKVVAESPVFITQIYCINTKSNKSGMNEAAKISLKLNETKNGNKLLSLFQVLKVVGFEEEYLKSLENLMREYNYYFKN
jgi:ABC transporter, phosphonate, periplasmic substrate-binding protein